MARKESGWLAFILIAAVAIALFYFGKDLFQTGTVLPDPYTPYDDFSYLDNTRWTFFEHKADVIQMGCKCDNYYSTTCQQTLTTTDNPSLGLISVSGNKLILYGGHLKCYENYAVATSKKVFSTENIKYEYTAKTYTQTGAGADTGSTAVEMSFAGTTIPLTGSCARVSSERNECSYGGKIEIKRYDDLDLNKFVVLVNGVETITGSQTQAEPIIFKSYGDLRIFNFGFEPYFSCTIDYNDEVVVRDKFTAGSKIAAENLTYVPLKFCPQDLGVLRFSAQGLTDEIGSLTTRLAKGEQLTVPAGEFWQIDYITKYVNSMKERCGVGYAYDTNIQKCVQIAYQMTPTQTLLYCTKDTECPLPQKCNDATVKCVNNSCDYKSTVCTPEQIINFVEVIKTVEVSVPEVKIISTGVNEITVHSNKDKRTHTIAGTTFTSTRPTILCSSPVGQITQQNCYQTQITYAGKTFTIKGGESYTLSPYISVKYIMTGTGAFVRENPDKSTYIDFTDGNWKDSFTLTFTNVYDIQLVSVPERLELGTSGYLQAKIRNNIHPHAGFIDYTTKKLMIDSYNKQRVNMNFVTGWNSITYTIPGDQLGGFVGELIPSVDLYNGVGYVADEKLFFGTYVTQDPGVLDCTKIGCTLGTCQGDGTCLVTQTKDCTTRGCTQGVCDSGSGNCIVTNYVYQDCRQKGCSMGTCDTSNGNCVVTTETNCVQNGCTQGSCDHGSGNCIVTNYINLNCVQLGCAAGTCDSSTGNCVVTAERDCKTNGCAQGTCDLPSGNCVINNYIETTISLDCRQLGCQQGICDRTTGYCVVTTETNCKVNGCTQGVCDPFTGSCTVNNYIEVPVQVPVQVPVYQDCRQLGCTAGTCLSTGVCAITQEINCRTNGCSQGYCDVLTGSCVVYSYINVEVPVNQDCRQLGCSVGTCNTANGVCESGGLPFELDSQTLMIGGAVVGGLILLMLVMKK